MRYLDKEVQVLDRRGCVLILGSSLYHADRFVYLNRIKEPAYLEAATSGG
jgi:hypothetical protein